MCWIWVRAYLLEKMFLTRSSPPLPRSRCAFVHPGLATQASTGDRARGRIYRPPVLMFMYKKKQKTKLNKKNAVSDRRSSRIRKLYIFLNFIFIRDDEVGYHFAILCTAPDLKCSLLVHFHRKKNGHGIIIFKYFPFFIRVILSTLLYEISRK